MSYVTVVVRQSRIARVAAFIVVTAASLLAPCYLVAADSTVQVQLNATKAGPRTVETLTERAILRDYRTAWSSMAEALESNTFDPLNGPFTGDAKQMLRDTIAGQQKSGLRERYTEQSHQVESVFYAPEGDVMELHDTAEYQLQVLDGTKVVSENHVVRHYIVLMTPSADRWLVRHLQAVSQF